MKTTDRNALIALPLVIAMGVLFAWAGSDGGARLGDTPLFMLLVAPAFIIQWIVFIPSFISQTEKFFDLTGSLTYTLVTLTALWLVPKLDARALLLGAVVIIWALRLGPFLFRRVSKSGHDDRFDAIKPSFVRFLNLWTIQGLWVTFTAAAAWVGITSGKRAPIGWLTIVGLLIWAIGFAIEVIADGQKTRFNADPANKGRFISAGLWSRSRHPNYFGEIMLWTGVAIMAAPTFHGWQWIALISPVFVTLLLTRVSGVPLLEKKADKKWGGQADYEEYKKNTPVLVPSLTSKNS